MKGTMSTISLAQTPRHKIKKLHGAGLFLTIIEHGGVRDLQITIAPQPGEHLSSVFERLNGVLKDHDAAIVKQQIFGATDSREGSLRLMKLVFGSITWPVTWVEGIATNGCDIAGMHVQAISGTRVEAVRLDGKVVGCTFDDGLAKHLLIGGLSPHDTFCSEAAQARQVYDQLESALNNAGMELREVIRTWFFLDDILDWYGDFNKVRNFIYTEKRGDFFPASTGVGARNGLGTALVVDAWAVQPLEGHVKITELASPLQCAAPNYGSGFSRAVEITTPGLRRVLVSGTASIDAAGRSVHPSNVTKQIEETMGVVGAILESRHQNFSHVTRATAYLKNFGDASHFTNWCVANEIEMPVVITQAEICRDELLFELELDVVAQI
jgi:enamine deaminase RidA (YjgF/YER057c/UK114 family)